MAITGRRRGSSAFHVKRCVCACAHSTSTSRIRSSPTRKTRRDVGLRLGMLANFWPPGVGHSLPYSSDIASLPGGTQSAPDARTMRGQNISPVRDHNSLGPTEDLDREPDGVPHDVVGLSALFSVLFAAVVLGMWLSGPTGRIAAVAICMVGVPMLVSNLRSRSERTRDYVHPSR